MEPQIQYAKTSDGVSIAYAIIGEGVPLVYASNVMGDLQWYLHNEDTRRQVDRLVAAGCRVIRYDMRGMGSSDRDVTDLSLSARVADLEAIVDSVGVSEFALCGYTHGNPAAIAYANNHPERVSRLMLVNPYATGASYYEKIQPARALVGLQSMAQDDWEFFTLTIASAMTGHGDPAQAQRTAELFRSSVSPAVYAAFSQEAIKTDLQNELAHISVQTLVVIDPAGVGNADLTKAVASQITGARLVTTDDYVEEAARFLGCHVASPSRKTTNAIPASSTVVILFADIADSTALTERLGDAAFREKARELDEALRRAIASNGGTAIDGKLLGDGVLATFGAAREAIACALAMQGPRAMGHGPSQDEALLLHIGIHAGDVIREENNVYGGAVNIAARVANEAAAGETLVSGTVRELARTSAGVSFEDRGERELKGVGEPVRVWAVVEQ